MKCCGYGSKGTTAIDNKGGYDCLMIPGLIKSDDSAILPESICGGGVGLIKTANKDATDKNTTLCCKK